jgi:hypothetical protein
MQRNKAGLSRAEWEAVSAKISAALAAIREAERAVQATQSKSLRGLLLGMLCRFFRIRLRASSACERDLGQETADKIFAGEGWNVW